MVAPIIPALTDHEIERILEAAAAAGASSAGYVLLRLPHEVKELFAGWLEAHAPERAEPRPVAGAPVPRRPAVRRHLRPAHARRGSLCRS